MSSTDPPLVSSRPVYTRHSNVRRVQVLGDREVITEGIALGALQDLFHYFMMISWPAVFATIAAFFLLFDILFGLLYSLVPGSIANLNPPGFLGNFFFSVETLATVGYGDMHPQTLYGHSVAAVEIFVGIMMLALITGLMFARFSRPRARFMFSTAGVVRPFDGERTLMFRAANARQNIVQDASAQLRLMRDDVTREGYPFRRIVDLPLVRSQHPAFLLSWTMMHVIDPSSPLYGETDESLRNADSFFILTMSGTDETTGQVLVSRVTYPASAVRWNHSFRDILERRGDGLLHLDFSKFDDVDPL